MIQDSLPPINVGILDYSKNFGWTARALSAYLQKLPWFMALVIGVCENSKILMSKIGICMMAQ